MAGGGCSGVGCGIEPLMVAIAFLNLARIGCVGHKVKYP